MHTQLQAAIAPPKARHYGNCSFPRSDHFIIFQTCQYVLYLLRHCQYKQTKCRRMSTAPRRNCRWAASVKKMHDTIQLESTFWNFVCKVLWVIASKYCKTKLRGSRVRLLRRKGFFLIHTTGMHCPPFILTRVDTEHKRDLSHLMSDNFNYACVVAIWGREN